LLSQIRWFDRYYSTVGGRLSRAGFGKVNCCQMPLGSDQGGQRFQEIKPDSVRLLVNFGWHAIPGMLG
jgi:hypothetical protein